MRALVFSAGGAFGAYQAGAWRALEEQGFQPDILAGASVGALNATLVARGCTGAQLQELWRDSRSDVFAWNWPPRNLGILDSRRLLRRIAELLERFPARCPARNLRVSLTEIPSTAIRVAADEEVTAERLLASCAIPLVYSPVRLEQRWYVDGGFFCRLPIRAAVEAGADEIVAVDVLAVPPSRLARGALRAAIGLRRFLTGEPDGMAAPAGVQLEVIASRDALGGQRDLLRWDRRNTERWLAAGYGDAKAASALPTPAAR